MKKYKSIVQAQNRAKADFIEKVEVMLETVQKQDQEEYIKSLEKLLIDFVIDLKDIKGLTNV